MQLSPRPSPGTPRLSFEPLIYGLAALLCVYAFATLRTDTRGLLNAATYLTLAGLASGAAYLNSSQYPWWQVADAWARQHHIRLLLLLPAIGLGMLTAIRHVVLLRAGVVFIGTTAALWALAWSTLLLALWPARPIGLSAWVRAHWVELLGVLAVTLLGAGLRFYRLGAIPNIIDGDEGLIGLWALHLGSPGVLGQHFAAMDGVGVLYLHLIRGVFDLLGPNTFALRLLPAIAGTLAIPATYVCARHLLGPRAAVVAVGLLTLSHAHIHFSRILSVSYIYATLFVPLALYFLSSGLERRSALRLALSVLMVGLHINFYVDGWVWLVLLLLLLAAWAIVDRPFLRGNAVNLGMFALALAIILAPMVIWGLMFPDTFSSRLAVDGTFSSGWLPEEARRTGTSEVWLVLDLFVRAVITFNQSPFIDFYHIGVPTLTQIGAVLWWFGLVLALLRAWDRRLIVLNGWFWGGIVALGVTTIPPSTYHYRLLVALPAAFMLAGLSADYVLRQLAPALRPAPAWRQRWSAGLIGTVLLAAAFMNMTTYFGTFAASCTYNSPDTRQASLLGMYLNTLPRETRIFVLPAESGFRYGPQRSVDFFADGMPIANIQEPLGAVPPAQLATGHPEGLAVVAVPARRAELEHVRGWFPGGQMTALTDCGAEVLSIYYLRPTTSDES